MSSAENFGITIQEEESYVDKVAKMIPGESVAAFLAIKAYLGTVPETDPRWYWFAVAGGALVCIIIRGYISRTNGRWNPQLLALSLLAFLFWSAIIIAPAFTGKLWEAVAYLGLIIMSLVGPELYRRFGGPVRTAGTA